MRTAEVEHDDGLKTGLRLRLCAGGSAQHLAPGWRTWLRTNMAQSLPPSPPEILARCYFCDPRANPACIGNDCCYLLRSGSRKSREQKCRRRTLHGTPGLLCAEGTLGVKRGFAWFGCCNADTRDPPVPGQFCPRLAFSLTLHYSDCLRNTPLGSHTPTPSTDQNTCPAQTRTAAPPHQQNPLKPSFFYTCLVSPSSSFLSLPTPL